jgi:uncharacterized protein YjbJ (UPF0337 family)
MGVPREARSKDIHMNWDRIQGNWKQVTGRAKEVWGALTDDEPYVIAGRREQLVGKIQERYGVAKDEAESQLAALGTQSERVVVQLSRETVVFDAHEPGLPGSPVAVTPQARSAKQAGASGGDRYRSVLRSCGEINDRRQWAAKRSLW